MITNPEEIKQVSEQEQGIPSFLTGLGVDEVINRLDKYPFIEKEKKEYNADRFQMMKIRGDLAEIDKLLERKEYKPKAMEERPFNLNEKAPLFRSVILERALDSLGGGPRGEPYQFLNILESKAKVLEKKRKIDPEDVTDLGDSLRFAFARSIKEFRKGNIPRINKKGVIDPIEIPGLRIRLKQEVEEHRIKVEEGEAKLKRLEKFIFNPDNKEEQLGFCFAFPKAEPGELEFFEIKPDNSISYRIAGQKKAEDFDLSQLSGEEASKLLEEFAEKIYKSRNLAGRQVDRILTKKGLSHDKVLEIQKKREELQKELDKIKLKYISELTELGEAA